jgi:DNA-directed RNA polymerase specialized sigma24 family protein
VRLRTYSLARLKENESALTQDEFDALLAWLDPDRDQAAQKYEEIRRRLIKIFVCRGCPVAEDLADETINRVAGKVEGVAPSYVGNPVLYFYGVAKKVYHEWFREWLRKQEATADASVADPVPDPDPPEPDREYDCLMECMKLLAPKDQDLILDYYQEEKQAKIDHRKKLAEGLGIGLNTLRIKVYRLRARLQECVEQLMKQFRDKQ